MELSEIADALRPHLDNALIATDFDGTLAPLVTDPEASRPVDGAVGALIALAERGAQIAVVTGRDARTALRLGGLNDIPRVIVSGVYGAETWRDGKLHTQATPAQVERLRYRLVPTVAQAGDADVWIEDKRLSLVVHTRKSRDPEAALAKLTEPVTRLGQDLGFEVHRGSNVLELRLPGYDKAGALRALAQSRAAVLYIGDDIGDLPVFAAIPELREEGMVAYGVGVLSSDVAEIVDASDVTVRDPEAVVELLRNLAT